MILTYDIIIQGRSINGGHCKKQLAVFGVEYPLKKGWAKNIIDKDYPEEQIKLFLSLKDTMFEKKPETKKGKMLLKKKKRAMQKVFRPFTIAHKNKEVPQITKQQKASYKKFLQSAYWTYVRNLVFKRDGKLCSRCPNTTKLQIHHTTYNNHFNEHNHLEDLIVLCKCCHEKEHNIEN